MTLMDGDDMHRLWSLVADLSAQLNLNRTQLASVQTQLETLKGHSLHSTTGYALRRFNVDVSKEKFESELERLNVQLIQENNDLKWENKQNEKLIKEYEQCLEIVMKKFRTFSHATQMHSLRLTQHYEDLLASNTHDAAAASLHASTTLSNTLSHLGGLVRSALREVDGEGEGAALDDALEHLETHGVQSEDQLGLMQAGYGSTSDPRWYGSGGYTGKLGDPEAQRSEAALERATEIQRLRLENEELRHLLDLTEGKGLESVGIGKDKLTLGAPRRKPSVGTHPTTAAAVAAPNPGDTVPSPQRGAQQSGPPRFSDMSAMPTAPLPTATIASPSASPVPPPAPLLRAQRAPLAERIQQAADLIKAKPAADPTPSPSEGTPAPAGTDASNPMVVVGTPPDSAPAQSDIRSAPILPLSVGPEQAESSAEAKAQEAAAAASAEEAVDLSEETDAKPLQGQAVAQPADADVPKDTAELTSEGESGAEASAAAEEKPPAAEDSSAAAASESMPESAEAKADESGTASDAAEAESSTAPPAAEEATAAADAPEATEEAKPAEAEAEAASEAAAPTAAAEGEATAPETESESSAAAAAAEPESAASETSEEPSTPASTEETAVPETSSEAPSSESETPAAAEEGAAEAEEKAEEPSEEKKDAGTEAGATEEAKEEAEAEKKEEPQAES